MCGMQGGEVRTLASSPPTSALRKPRPTSRVRLLGVAAPAREASRTRNVHATRTAVSSASPCGALPRHIISCSMVAALQTGRRQRTVVPEGLSPCAAAALALGLGGSYAGIKCPLFCARTKIYSAQTPALPALAHGCASPNLCTGSGLKSSDLYIRAKGMSATASGPGMLQVSRTGSESGGGRGFRQHEGVESWMGKVAKWAPCQSASLQGRSTRAKHSPAGAAAGSCCSRRSPRVY